MKIKFWKRKLLGGDTYAVNTGDYVGELLTYVESSEDHYHFLSIPSMVNREIPKEKFDFGKEHNIIEFVERIPKKVFRITEEKFIENRGKVL